MSPAKAWQRRKNTPWVIYRSVALGGQDGHAETAVYKLQSMLLKHATHLQHLLLGYTTWRSCAQVFWWLLLGFCFVFLGDLATFIYTFYSIYLCTLNPTHVVHGLKPYEIVVSWQAEDGRSLRTQGFFCGSSKTDPKSPVSLPRALISPRYVTPLHLEVLLLFPLQLFLTCPPSFCKLYLSLSYNIWERKDAELVWNPFFWYCFGVGRGLDGLQLEQLSDFSLSSSDI